MKTYGRNIAIYCSCELVVGIYKYIRAPLFLNAWDKYKIYALDFVSCIYFVFALAFKNKVPLYIKYIC